MKLKFQMVFFTLLLGLAGCFGDDEAEQVISEERGQPAFSPVDADRRLETVIDNLEEEDENGNEEEDDVPLDEYLEEQEALAEAEPEEEPEDFIEDIEDDEYESLPED